MDKLMKDKTLFIPENADYAGISITWLPESKSLQIWGWYDSSIDIKGECITLKTFFNKLNISKKDCKNAYK